MGFVRRGLFAAGLAGGAVVIAGLIAVWGVVRALDGEWSLLLAPLIGLPIALAVFRALQLTCRRGDVGFGIAAAGGIALLFGLAIVGASLGGVPLLAPAVVLAVALVVTPRRGAAHAG
jgi:hypothetical protein